jgi:decaprenylphospho-beta-D-ribofuranose 2-oxidase
VTTQTLKRVLLIALLLSTCGIGAALLDPLYRPSPPTEPPLILDDVARLNPTAVREVVQPATEDEIREAVLRASATGTKVTIGGKRHSMGGQTLYPGSISIDMTQFNRIISLDVENKILVVQSGATWREIQEYLNPHGLAVLTMQGPNIFTVGGSISVNAHGWDMRAGPVGASVAWLRIVMADGSIERCSREENPELFHLVVGGYGLFGVILDVGLRVTDNAAYAANVSEMDYSQIPIYFENELRSDPTVELGEADLSISPGSLLREGIATIYAKQSGDTRRTDPLESEHHVFRDRYFFALSRSYAWGKSARWALQKRLEYPVPGEVRTRNNIFRSPVERLGYYSPNDADILQEYFIPPQHFVAFIDDLREIVERRRVNLLDATVRYVEPNDDAFLNYSREPSLSVVLYVNVKTSAEGLAEASAMTEEIIGAAERNDGTFYLPYMLDYTRSQLLLAYPIATQFFAAKRRYDPAEVFENDFYMKYGH